MVSVLNYQRKKLNCLKLKHIKGGMVNNVRRFKAREGGNKNSPVLLSFEGNELPERVFIGCMLYQVRAYERPPLRCFKCQRFWHMAASCRGNRRCAKCGGDHDILKCEMENKKRCNCGGEHMASLKECNHFMKAKQVLEVKNGLKISFAEVRKVESDKGAAVIEMRTPPSAGRHYVSRDSNEIINKEALLAFIVDVIYGALEMKSRSDIITFVAEAAARSLGVKGYTPEALHGYMSASQLQTEQGPCVGKHSERGDVDWGDSTNEENSDEEE